MTLQVRGGVWNFSVISTGKGQEQLSSGGENKKPEFEAQGDHKKTLKRLKRKRKEEKLKLLEASKRPVTSNKLFCFGI